MHTCTPHISLKLLSYFKLTDNEMYGKHYEMEPDYNHATPYEVPQESLKKDGHFSTLQSPVYEPTAGTNIYASPDPMVKLRVIVDILYSLKMHVCIY